MNGELKPCPFCGTSEINIFSNGHDPQDWSISCETIDCAGTTDYLWDSPIQAIEAWNKRHE